MSRDSVTVLTEYFHPEEASTAQLLTELTTGLASSFDVSVITALPNYHDDDQDKSVRKREQIDGVDLTRVRSTRFDKDSLAFRVINWLSFTLLSAIRLVLRRGQQDCLLVLSNPPIVPAAAWLNKRLYGTPYVYLVYDMYPDMPVALGLLSEDHLVTRLWRRGMRLIYRDADRIVVLGESMERRLRTKLEDDDEFAPEKIEIIPNWEDGEFIKPMDKSANEFAQEHGTVEPFTLLYSGNIGRFHELRTAIDGIACLESRGRTDIELLIIGEGARKEELRQYVDERGIENVRFMPYQPLDRLSETLTCADAALVGIKPEMEGMCVSSKLYSALAAGTPILAIVGEGDEVARVVRSENCGSYVTPGAPTAAADVLEYWADNPTHSAELGRNARACFENGYTVEHATEAYERLLRGVIA